jgi:hypothetical protein
MGGEGLRKNKYHSNLDQFLNHGSRLDLMDKKQQGQNVENAEQGNYAKKSKECVQNREFWLLRSKSAPSPDPE